MEWFIIVEKWDLIPLRSLLKACREYPGILSLRQERGGYFIPQLSYLINQVLLLKIPGSWRCQSYLVNFHSCHSSKNQKISSAKQGWSPAEMRWRQVTPASSWRLQQQLKPKKKGQGDLRRCRTGIYFLLPKSIKGPRAWITMISPALLSITWAAFYFRLSVMKHHLSFSESVTRFPKLANSSKLSYPRGPRKLWLR